MAIQTSPGGGASLAWFLIASLAVIGLALLATKLLARWQFMPGRGRRIRVLEATAIARDRHLVLVQVGKEVLLLGSAEGGITVLRQVDDPDLVRQWLEEVPPEGPPSVGRLGLDGLNGLAGLESSIRGNLDRIRQRLQKNGGRPDA